MRFSQEEARVILKQAGQAEFSGEQSEVDLDQLLTLAEEAGLSRQAVLNAMPASILSMRGQPQKPGLFGGPISQSIMLEVTGTLTELGWQNAVSRLRSESGDPGEPTQHLQTRIWTASFGGTHTLQILASPSGSGETLLEGRLQTKGISLLIHLLGIGGALIAGPILGATLKLGLQETVAAVFASALALFIASRQAVTFFSDKESANLKRLMVSASAEISRASSTEVSAGSPHNASTGLRLEQDSRVEPPMGEADS